VFKRQQASKDIVQLDMQSCNVEKTLKSEMISVNPVMKSSTLWPLNCPCNYIHLVAGLCVHFHKTRRLSECM